jgi:hypothetical protein
MLEATQPVSAIVVLWIFVVIPPGAARSGAARLAALTKGMVYALRLAVQPGGHEQDPFRA